METSIIFILTITLFLLLGLLFKRQHKKALEEIFKLGIHEGRTREQYRDKTNPDNKYNYGFRENDFDYYYKHYKQK